MEVKQKPNEVLETRARGCPASPGGNEKDSGDLGE
jgi:hypothetical protein